MAEPTPALTPPSVVQAIGGVRGLVDSAVPATVFVLVRLASHSLGTAVGAALASGVVLAVLRAVRREPLTQVGSGFLGLVVAVLVARATGTGKGFFLPGILVTAMTGVAFVVSLVAGRPAVGLALAAFDDRYAGWRSHPGLRRACARATAFWAVTFFLRAGIAGLFYQRKGDHPGELLIVINAVKWPLIAAAAAVSVVLVRRSGYPGAGEVSPPPP